MNQTCKVCGEPAAGFHFGAFTCEGCKSFFGRSYNNTSSILECKNNGKCIIDKKNRTTCKACRLRKCYSVGMSKGGSRYGRRSNWFKIHCLLQEQQQQAMEAAHQAAANGATGPSANNPTGNSFVDMSAAAAAQHRNSHMAAAAAQHMGSLLGYPSYLPTAEMMAASAGAGSPFMPSAGPTPGAALPFFSMLPSIGSPQSAFQLPPHLLFPGYHPSAAAAVAAADAAYRSEMYRHRQSVDSAASTESQQRFSPHSRSQLSPEQRVPSASSINSLNPTSQSPDLYPMPIATSTNSSAYPQHHIEDERRSVLSSNHSSSPVSLTSSTHHPHQIHSPIAIRATPKTVSPTPTTVSVGSQSHTPEPAPITQSTNENPENATPLSFTAKMQSLSPVSVCSITAETTPSAATSSLDVEIGQDCPMDLSMKTSRSSVHSFNTSAGESGVHSDVSEEESMPSVIPRSRKYHELSSENDSDASSDATDSAKRQKINADTTPQNYNSFSHNAASLRGIFVCV